MNKKLLSLLLTGGIFSTLMCSIPVYATDYDVSSSSQYLNQTIPYNSNQHGWYKFPNGSWGYFVNHNQLIKNSTVNEGDNEYAIGDDGKMLTGWFKDSTDHKSYFFRSDGVECKGWLKTDGLWYYFDNTGAMMTGWQKINNIWYFFNKDTGVMAHNIKVDGYYLTSDGSLQ